MVRTQPQTATALRFEPSTTTQRQEAQQGEASSLWLPHFTSWGSGVVRSVVEFLQSWGTNEFLSSRKDGVHYGFCMKKRPIAHHRRRTKPQNGEQQSTAVLYWHLGEPANPRFATKTRFVMMHVLQDRSISPRDNP